MIAGPSRPAADPIDVAPRPGPDADPAASARLLIQYAVNILGRRLLMDPQEAFAALHHLARCNDLTPQLQAAMIVEGAARCPWQTA
ncbi:MAG TPA: hypothetical protein VHU88_18325 [Sporichthyaceae bacterium]|jgi:hypothetical protein|nr:hypothetical protein [Sporichthyaceae bacterium]